MGGVDYKWFDVISSRDFNHCKHYCLLRNRQPSSSDNISTNCSVPYLLTWLDAKTKRPRGERRPFLRYWLCGNTPLVCGPFQVSSSAPTPVSVRPFSGPSTTPTRANQRPVSGPHLSYSLTNHKTAYCDQWQTTHKPSWPNKKRLHRPVKSVSTHTADNALDIIAVRLEEEQ